MLHHAGLIEPEPEIRAALAAAGIEVVALGPGSAARGCMERHVEGWLRHRRCGLPLVVLKTAQSLDAKVACGDGTSQWITGPEARGGGQLLRAWSHAVLVGSQVVPDPPELQLRC